MIVITGAAGKTGRAVISALVGRGQAVRALVRRPEHASVVEGLGAAQVVVGDMRQQPVVDQAFEDMRAVYHIPPNMSPDELSIGRVAIESARLANVGHFAYHSVLHPQTEAMPHHWRKLRVEEALLESGLPFTILQPAAYMQNVLAHWDSIVEAGIYPVPYAAEARLSMVDLRDVAEAAAIVLTELGHVGATYELSGPELISQVEISEVLSEQLGRPVHVHVVSLAAWEQRARQSGLGSYQIESLVRMFGYYDRYGFPGNPRVLGWLLGRPPTTFATFVQQVARERLGTA